MRAWRSCLLVNSLCVVLPLFGQLPTAGAQTEVAVVNSPKVEVPAPIPHSELVRFDQIRLSGSSSECKLEFVGLLRSAGYSRVMLSLAAEIQGANIDPGVVGVALIPDEPFVIAAFENDSVILFELRAEVTVGSGSPDIVGSLPFQHPLSFPSYRVFAYNTTDKPVKAQLYAYLTH